MKPFILLFGLCAALSLTACNKEKNVYEEYGFKESDFPIHKLPKGDAPPKHVKINPNRKEHYQAVVKIKDAPLTFQIVTGDELYQSENCKYVTNRWVGATTWPQYRKKLEMIKVDNNTYVTDFYSDTPLDEDYYGEGVCKWQFLSAAIVMEPTGKDERETALIVRIDPEDLKKLTVEHPELKVTNHYEKNFYPIATEFQGNGSVNNGYSDRGIESWHKNVTNYKPDSLFTVELTLRKVEK
ncbi:MULTISPECIES: hypothetical protein [unclassified Neisseria]|jgi:putative secreted protein|nr:hypothetical protein HMPREF3156_00084 [Neisseria sp. HMSC06F02]OFS02860.1 hypothetical protein HMPREF2954_04900 [Neisseria sp. HMSC067H09]